MLLQHPRSHALRHTRQLDRQTCGNKSDKNVQNHCVEFTVKSLFKADYRLDQNRANF
jgi:hypothetical protein